MGGIRKPRVLTDPIWFLFVSGDGRQYCGLGDASERSLLSSAGAAPAGPRRPRRIRPRQPLSSEYSSDSPVSGSG